VVDVSSSGVSGSGTASGSELGSGSYAYIDKVQILHQGLGSSIEIKSDKLRCSKNILSSPHYLPVVGFGFSMGTGIARLGVWNEFSSAWQDSKLDGCDYSGSLLASTPGIHLDGAGSRMNSYEGASGLVQNLSLSHLGKSARTDLAFKELDETGNPLDFEWSAYANSFNSDWAQSGVKFDLNYGDKFADFSLAGESDVSHRFDQPIRSIDVNKTVTEESWWIKYLITPQEVSLELL
jgi:hypothetical protein